MYMSKCMCHNPQSPVQSPQHDLHSPVQSNHSTDSCFPESLLAHTPQSPHLSVITLNSTFLFLSTPVSWPFVRSRRSTPNTYLCNLVLNCQLFSLHPPSVINLYSSLLFFLSFINTTCNTRIFTSLPVSPKWSAI